MCVQKHVDENEVSIDSLLATTDSFCFVFTTRQQQESNNKNNNNMVDLLERLEVLLQVEDVSYRTIDYLSPSHQQYLHQQQQQQQQQQDERNPNSLDIQSTFKATVASSSSSSSQSGINEVWREKICEWSYQVIDHFDFSREVVSVSIHYLDRFLATTPVNKKLFQLVAMTALYLAIKIHEPANLTMKSMIELSRGYFSPAQMAEMEMAILRYVSSCRVVVVAPKLRAKPHGIRRHRVLFPPLLLRHPNPFSRLKSRLFGRENPTFIGFETSLRGKRFFLSCCSVLSQKLLI
jgi:Cyclin, N-terminal domain